MHSGASGSTAQRLAMTPSQCAVLYPFANTDGHPGPGFVQQRAMAASVGGAEAPISNTHMVPWRRYGFAISGTYSARSSEPGRKKSESQGGPRTSRARLASSGERKRPHCPGSMVGSRQNRGRTVFSFGSEKVSVSSAKAKVSVALVCVTRSAYSPGVGVSSTSTLDTVSPI
ncbi:PP237 [Orf virus]|uniref:PP237 n=1 Tax=Orf virus TaxID=10258 RepID=F1AXB9_ORFV|nr:PP237 [Orf virus]